MGIVSVLGWVLMKLMGVLVYIAQYNSFLSSKAVSNGWVIVRDVCNMFFVLILLLIAFATILHIEKYNYKKWLPKLILMAILINFSKTICGLLIDAAQIIMLTFVNAFKDIAGANLVDILGIKDWQSLEGIEKISNWEIVGAYMLAVIYVIISIIVIAAMIGMLVMRIVMIWIYVVLSPLAYLLSAFPNGQAYASSWWSEFSKNLIIGPILAFFIWLSFTSLANFQATDLNISGQADGGIACQDDGSGACMMGTSDLLIKFIIAIGMLLGGMKITQDIGGVAGKAAGSAFSKGKALAIGAGVGALAMAKRGTKNASMAAINNKKVRGLLDRVGAADSRNPGGAFLRFTGLRKLAREGSLTLGRHKMEVEEKAKKKVEAFKKAGATRTVQQIASGEAFGMYQKAAQKQARKLAPVFSGGVESFDRTAGTVGLDPAQQLETENWLKNMSAEDYRAMDSSVIAKIGKAGINLNNIPKFREFLQKNAQARGDYNSGQIDAGLHNYVAGVDSRGQELRRNKYGTLTLNRNDRDKLFGRTPDTRFNLRTNYDNENEEYGDDYGQDLEERMNRHAAGQTEPPEIQEQRNRIMETMAPEERNNRAMVEDVRRKIDSWNREGGQDNFQSAGQIQEALRQVKEEKYAPGEGNLAVNKLARGGSMAAFDFNQLDAKTQASLKQQLKPGKDLSDIQGFNTDDKTSIKQIAASLIGAINKELQGLDSFNGSLSPGQAKRKENLENARAQLANPEKLSNLSLLNSSARGFNRSGGLSDVKETVIHEDVHGLGIKDEALTDDLSKNALRDRKYDVREGGATFSQYVEQSMDNIRGQKSASSKSVIEVLKQESGSLSEESAPNQVTNIYQNKENREKAKAEFQNQSTQNPNEPFLVYYLKRFAASLNKFGSNLNNNRPLSATPPKPRPEKGRGGPAVS